MTEPSTPPPSRRRPRVGPLLLLAALALSSTPVTASDAGRADAGEWPSIRGRDQPTLGRPWPERPGLALAWRRPLGSGYSGVVASGGRLVTAWSADGRDWLGAFALADGAPGWKVDLGPTFPGRDGAHEGPVATPALAAGAAVMLTPRGKLLAVEAASGAARWEVDLAAEPGVPVPHYGFGTSPLIADGVVVVELEVPGSHFVAGYDLATGERRWKAGDDSVGYPSPAAIELAGTMQVVAPGARGVVGLRPATGEVLWSLGLETEESRGGSYAIPLALGGDRILLGTSPDGAVVARVTRRDDGAFVATREWAARTLGRTYAPPVRHGETVFGFAGVTLSAIDAATGERLWRTREPGDGWPLVVDDRLLVLTKHGGLHLAPAGRDGWNEEAALDLFSDHAWTAPIAAGGRIVARSLGELAAVDVVAAATSGIPPTRTAGGATPAAGAPAEGGFAAFLASLAGATEATAGAEIDRRLAALPPGPVVEGGRVHFLYRGPAQDVAIAGDHLGAGIQQPMPRVGETDLFVGSTELSSDALVGYRFVRDFDQPIGDPRNPWTVTEGGRPRSWLAMSGYPLPDFLGEPPADRRGTLASHEVPLEGGSRHVDVWLPPGYVEDGARLPVAYWHFGNEALAMGRIAPILDHLVGGGRLPPLVVVFVGNDDATAGEEFFGDRRDAYVAWVADTLVPFVDRTYATRAEPPARASVGVSDGGMGALVVGLRRPDVFGVVATQSAYMLTTQEDYLASIVPAPTPPLRVALEWSTIDLRGTDEHWDIGGGNARLAERLRAAGHSLETRVVRAGHGWESFRTRADWLLGALFPDA